MKSLILFLFFSSTALAIPSGSQNALQLGGGGSGTSSNLVIPEANSQGYFTLYSGSTTFTLAKYQPFYKNGALYQVPSGKTFKVVQTCVTASVSAPLLQLVTDTSTFNYENTGPLVAGKFQGGVAGAYAMTGNATASSEQCSNQAWDMAQNTWGGVTASATGAYTVRVTGKEI